MRNRVRNNTMAVSLAMAAIMLTVYCILPALIPGVKENITARAITTGVVSAESIGDEGGMQSDKNIQVSFEIGNGRGEEVVVTNMKLTTKAAGVTIKENTGSLSIPSNGTQTVSFSVEISKNASLGNKLLTFEAELRDTSGNLLFNQSKLSEDLYFEVYEKMATDINDPKIVAALDITHGLEPSDGFVQGNDNKLKLVFYNYGNTTIKNTKIAITLPDGLSIYNGSNQADLGYVSVGTKKTAEFPITVKEGIESKNYPVEVEVLGLNFMNSEVLAKKTFYIPVESDGEISSSNISITDINMQEEVLAGENFDMSFTVKNTGKSEIKNVKVNVEPAEGVINKSKNIFIDNIPKGGSKQYSVRFYTFEGSEEKSYPIKITAGSTNTEDATAVTQYATISVISDGTVAKKPQLMVDNYTYGGSNVQAGSDFNLNLGIFNTSAKTLSNIKVAISTEEGTFVPTGSSNAFFIDSIPAKGHYTKSIRLSAKPQAEQKTTAVTVAMTYEDSSGNSFEATDTISVPVTQQTRLVVDDLVPPMEVYAGMQGTSEIQFYNMGKTVLNNLRVNCTGNFDVMESNSYYVGNMESGKSDSYRFNFTPRDIGPVEGTITFTFEDGNGNPQFLEVPFVFEAMEMPVWDEDMEMVDPEKKPVPWSLIIAGAVLAAAIVGGILFKRHRKKKLHAALEIEDDFDIDIKEEIEQGTDSSSESENTVKTSENNKKPESK